MASKRTYRSECLRSEFTGTEVYTFPMKVKDVVEISYVAVRGRDDEEGAVQRVLSKRRIKSIKDFVLSDNMFFNTFILNWTNQDAAPTTPNGHGKITLQIVANSAQVIDGQHRLAGLEAAMREKDDVGKSKILVSLCIGLTTKGAAAIFLNINTEQRPAPKSLIYDLFGEVEDDADHVINRANDIAKELNDNPQSPFCGRIKYPGTPRGAGVIDLSTVVSSLKGHLNPEGVFAKVNLRSLNYQQTVLTNYFQAIRTYYEKQGLWNNKVKNPFFRSAGFTGAIEYLTSTLLMKCAEKKSFKQATFKELLHLESADLLVHEDIKGLGGTAAKRKIKEYLESHLLSSFPEQDEYDF